MPRSLRGQTIRVIAVNADTLAEARCAAALTCRPIAKRIDYMYSSDQAIKDYAEFAKIDETMAKRVRDEFFPRSIVDPDEDQGARHAADRSGDAEVHRQGTDEGEQLAELFPLPLKK